MLNRKTPLTLAATLTIKGQGEEITFPVVFHNRTVSQITAKKEELETSEKGQADAEWVSRELFLFLVESVDGEPCTHTGVVEMEENWPGAMLGIFHRYHEVRRVDVVKN